MCGRPHTNLRLQVMALMRIDVNDERGFTLLEIMMVVALMGVLAGMAALITPTFVQHAKAEGGIEQVLDVFRSARETAISQRRNVEIRFVGTTVIQTVRDNIPNGTTVLSTVQLENRVQFLLVPGVPDTPDAFGNATATAFGNTASRMFTSEGTFVDANGDVLNGSLFLAIPGQVNSARAVTVFGMTALLRAWRWNGARWTE
jgi:prepilin-type N-terminal cleavage/methylation domain-containing protein